MRAVVERFDSEVRGRQLNGDSDIFLRGNEIIDQATYDAYQAVRGKKED